MRRTQGPWRFNASVLIFRKCRDLPNYSLNLVRSNKPRTFELPRRVAVTRTPEKIFVVEAAPDVVPTTVTGVPVDHPERRREFGQRVAEAADQYHRRAGRPGKP